MRDVMGPVISLGIFVLAIAGVWKVYAKAGEPGWAAIVPVYNLVVMLKIAHKPVWWILLMLVPFVNFIVFIIISVALAENFGKSTGFGLGLAFLGVIFFPILGFGEAQYEG